MSLRIDLTQRTPSLSAEQMRAGFVPSPRFGTVSFDDYRPNPKFPGQRDALERLRDFALHPPQPRKVLGLWRRGPLEGVGYYLDGGFGVGKTHLLAATWHAFEGTKAFLSFAELFYVLGMLGISSALETFRAYRLLCIDEFELDDPGNAHMANTFLATLMPGGTHVVTTSNTQPGQLGQGRFNASDFQRQIQGIAGRFVVLAVDGPDFRQRVGPLAPLRSREQLDALEQTLTRPYTRLDLDSLNQHLLRVHPARFGKLLEGIHTVLLENLRPISDQGVALRLVHFVDKVYDLHLPLAASGVPLEQLFDSSYRFGAFQKKYSRCLSRLGELVAESGSDQILN